MLVVRGRRARQAASDRRASTASSASSSAVRAGALAASARSASRRCSSALASASAVAASASTSASALSCGAGSALLPEPARALGSAADANEAGRHRASAHSAMAQRKDAVVRKEVRIAQG